MNRIIEALKAIIKSPAPKPPHIDSVYIASLKRALPTIETVASAEVEESLSLADKGSVGPDEHAPVALGDFRAATDALHQRVDWLEDRLRTKSINAEDDERISVVLFDDLQKLKSLVSAESIADKYLGEMSRQNLYTVRALIHHMIRENE